MDLILILLVVADRASGGRGVVASELAEPSARAPRDVRASLSRLEALGLVKHEVAGSRGPLGTYRWRATDAGRSAAARPIAFLSRCKAVTP